MATIGLNNTLWAFEPPLKLRMQNGNEDKDCEIVCQQNTTAAHNLHDKCSWLLQGKGV